MRKIVLMKVMVLVFLVSVLAGGCAYTLRYSVTSRLTPGESTHEGERTFYLKRQSAIQKTGRGQETATVHETGTIAEILEKALIDLGWRTVPDSEAKFIVGIDAFSEKKKEWGGPLFDTVFAEIRPDFGGRLVPQRRQYYIHYIDIRVSPDREIEGPVWTCRIRTNPVEQDLVTLGRHMIPAALRYYPEEGSWELQQNVYLHSRRDEAD